MNYRLKLVHWQFIQIMDLLDQELADIPKQGKGSTAANFKDRYEEQWLMLQARLIDASNINFSRFSRLYFDEQIYLMLQNKQEWELLHRLITIRQAQLKTDLAKNTDLSQTASLLFEQQAFEQLLTEMA